MSGKKLISTWLEEDVFKNWKDKKEATPLINWFQKFRDGKRNLDPTDEKIKKAKKELKMWIKNWDKWHGNILELNPNAKTIIQQLIIILDTKFIYDNKTLRVDKLFEVFYEARFEFVKQFGKNMQKYIKEKINPSSTELVNLFEFQHENHKMVMNSDEQTKDIEENMHKYMEDILDFKSVYNLARRILPDETLNKEVKKFAHLFINGEADTEMKNYPLPKFHKGSTLIQWHIQCVTYVTNSEQWSNNKVLTDKEIDSSSTMFMEEGSTIRAAYRYRIWKGIMMHVKVFREWLTVLTMDNMKGLLWKINKMLTSDVDKDREKSCRWWFTLVYRTQVVLENEVYGKEIGYLHNMIYTSPMDKIFDDFNDNDPVKWIKETKFIKGETEWWKPEEEKKKIVEEKKDSSGDANYDDELFSTAGFSDSNLSTVSGGSNNTLDSWLTSIYDNEWRTDPKLDNKAKTEFEALLPYLRTTYGSNKLPIDSTQDYMINAKEEFDKWKTNWNVWHTLLPKESSLLSIIHLFKHNLPDDKLDVTEFAVELKNARFKFVKQFGKRMQKYISENIKSTEHDGLTPLFNFDNLVQDSQQQFEIESDIKLYIDHVKQFSNVKDKQQIHDIVSLMTWLFMTNKTDKTKDAKTMPKFHQTTIFLQWILQCIVYILERYGFCHFEFPSIEIARQIQFSYTNANESSPIFWILQSCWKYLSIMETWGKLLGKENINVMDYVLKIINHEIQDNTIDLQRYATWWFGIVYYTHHQWKLGITYEQFKQYLILLIHTSPQHELFANLYQNGPVEWPNFVTTFFQNNNDYQPTELWWERKEVAKKKPTQPEPKSTITTTTTVVTGKKEIKKPLAETKVPTIHEQYQQFHKDDDNWRTGFDIHWTEKIQTPQSYYKSLHDPEDVIHTFKWERASGTCDLWMSSRSPEWMHVYYTNNLYNPIPERSKCLWRYGLEDVEVARLIESMKKQYQIDWSQYEDEMEKRYSKIQRVHVYWGGYFELLICHMQDDTKSRDIYYIDPKGVTLAPFKSSAVTVVGCLKTTVSNGSYSGKGGDGDDQDSGDGDEEEPTGDTDKGEQEGSEEGEADPTKESEPKSNDPQPPGPKKKPTQIKIESFKVGESVDKSKELISKTGDATGKQQKGVAEQVRATEDELRVLGRPKVPQ